MASSKAPQLPSTLATRFVRSVMGFGVAVGLGLAPFLGKIKIQGYDALSTLFPEDLQLPLIPISAVFMGVIAAALQFYSREAVNRAFIRRSFRFTLLGLVAGLFLLVILYTFLVERVSFEASSELEPVIIALSRTKTCGCGPSTTDNRCLQELTKRPDAIESCWGSGPLKMSRLALSLNYVIVFSGFGVLIGLLLLQEEAQKKQKRRPRKAAARSGPSPEPDHGTS